MQRLDERLGNGESSCSIHLDEEDSNANGFLISHWLKNGQKHKEKPSNLYHLDISLVSEIVKNDLLFSLSVLNGIMDNSGQVWICSYEDIYLPEMTLPHRQKGETAFYELLPILQCMFPKEVSTILDTNNCVEQPLFKDSISGNWKCLMDFDLYSSPKIQRPFQYLSLYEKNDPALESFSYKDNLAKGTEHILECLNVLLRQV